MWWLFKRDPKTKALYKKMRKAERKWRRLHRRKLDAQHRGDQQRAAQLLQELTHWLGVYNSAVMNLYPEDYI